MVRVSIYNEKGGVGKTTITVMMASFLAYGCGKRVCVLDFDYPAFHLKDLRERETLIRKTPRSPLSIWLRDNPPPSDPYDIFSFLPGRGGTYRPLEVFTSLEEILPGGYDYVLFDFPGRFSQGEPVSFIAANGYLDFVAVPMDTDLQSRRSALVVSDALTRIGIPVALFWNRVSLSEARGDGSRFRQGAEPFLERGLEVMETGVRDIRKFSRDSSEMAFIRSTLCFPVRYINMWSPAIIPFLEALRLRIDNAKTAQP